MSMPLKFILPIAIVAFPFIFFLAYGIHGGMPWDYSLAYLSESNPGLSGFLYSADPLRIYTNVFYHIGYHLSEMFGLTGDWVGYHLIYCLLWIARGFLVYLLCRLIDLNQIISAAAALLSVLHGSDVSIGHVGQLNQFGIVLWTLLAMCCFLVFLRRQDSARYVFVICAAGFSYLALWSHEATLLGLLLFPILFVWLSRTPRDSAAYFGATIFYAPAATYAVLMADRLLIQRTGASWQETVMRSDHLPPAKVFSDYVFLVAGLFNVPGWITGKNGGAVVGLVKNTTASLNVNYSAVVGSANKSFLLAIGLIIIFGISLFAACCDGDKDRRKSERSERKNLALASAFFILASAFLVPYLALNIVTNGYWRVEILASPFASICGVLVLYSLVVQMPLRLRLPRWTGGLIFCSIVSAVLVLGYSADAAMYQFWNDRWKKISAPIARLLQAVPSVQPGTVVMLQDVPVGLGLDVPATFAAWQSNFWFDILLRLAYPHTLVAGSYSYNLTNTSQAEIEDVIRNGGKIIQLPSGSRVLSPDGHMYMIDGWRVTQVHKDASPLIDFSSIRHVIALNWTDNGPFEVINNAKSIELAVAPDEQDYAPLSRIAAAGLSEVARRRFSVQVQQTRSPPRESEPEQSRNEVDFLAPTEVTPLGTLEAQNGGALSTAGGSLALTTPPQQWAYAASGTLMAPRGTEGPAPLRVRLQVEQGRLGIGVLDRADPSRLLAEQAVDVTSAPVAVYLDLPDVSKIGSIVFRSWSPNGIRTRARIFSIETVLDRVRFRMLAGSTENIPLDTFRSQNGGTLASVDRAISLTTPPQQWAYAASAPLPLPAGATGPAAVHVRLQVEQGRLGIGVLAQGDSTQMLAENSAGVTGAPIDIYIELADASKAGSIVLRSWSPNGISVRARILSIEIVLEHEPVQKG